MFKNGLNINKIMSLGINQRKTQKTAQTGFTSLSGFSRANVLNANERYH